MTLDKQIEADFKRHGTLSETYLMRKYNLTWEQARVYLREKDWEKMSKLFSPEKVIKEYKFNTIKSTPLDRKN